MKNWKPTAYIAIIVLAALALGCVVWFSASYFFSLSAQVNQNTQNIQSNRAVHKSKGASITYAFDQ